MSAAAALRAAAEAIRSMPDDELVRLALGAHAPPAQAPSVPTRPAPVVPPPTADRRAHVLNYLQRRQGQWVTGSDIRRALGIQERDAVSLDLRSLAAGGACESNGERNQRLAYRVREPRTAKRKAKRGADEEEGEPAIEPGRGERHPECRHYEACLDRFTVRYRRHLAIIDGAARCPVGCRHYDQVPRHQLLSLAVTQVAQGKPSDPNV